MKRIVLYNKSRMMGDHQVRFCERFGVKLPLSTRLLNVVAVILHIKHLANPVSKGIDGLKKNKEK